LLELLNGSDNTNGGSDELLVVFGLEGIFDHLNVLVGDNGGLIHLSDTE